MAVGIQLAVVIASLLQHKSSLGLGNVVGSSISNILGAFSLGLLFYTEHGGRMEFDRSAKIYTGVLFLVTTLFAIVALTDILGLVAGVVFLVVFGVYLGSIGWGIYRGVLEPPKEEGEDDEEGESTREREREEEPLILNGRNDISPPMTRDSSPFIAPGLGQPSIDLDDSKEKKHPHSLLYHVAYLILGFIALSISGYVLSHTSSSLASSFHLSGTLLGITLLSFATTLPEKFVSVLSGLRGHGGIIVASTAGSNIFLLTLCLGVVFVSSPDVELGEGLSVFEIWVAWLSSALLLGIVWVGGRRWIGGLLLLGYLGFLGLEFTVFRR
jgi:Ca2+/Na+ antiporter